MQRINTSSAVDIGGGNNGFTNGNPATSQPATDLSSDWCNAVQEEIANVIENASLALDENDNTQLHAAIVALIAANQTPSAPSGSVTWFAAATAPTGYLKANGAAISRTTYAALFAVIGTTFGAGDGSTTFNIPDLRGEFIRGFDDGRGIDSGRAFGTAQLDALQDFDLQGQYLNVGSAPGCNNLTSPSKISGAVQVSSPLVEFDMNATKNARTASETRSRNIALLACIKY